MDEQTPPLAPHHNTFLIAAIVIVILLLGGIFIYLYSVRQGQVPEVTPPPSEPAPTAPQTPPAGELETKAQEIPVPRAPEVPKAITNPVQGLPSANPLDTQTNPFENAYKNPFE